MQEGGTLVVDEIVNGVNIDCKDTVLSNGKDITIEGHSAVIRFADSATIIMNDASLIKEIIQLGPALWKRIISIGNVPPGFLIISFNYFFQLS